MLHQKFIQLVLDKTIKLSDLLESNYDIGGGFFSFSSTYNSLLSYLDYPYFNTAGQYSYFSYGFAFRDNYYNQYLDSTVFYPGYAGLDYSDYVAISDTDPNTRSEIRVPNGISAYTGFIQSANAAAETFFNNLSLFYHKDLTMTRNNILAFKEYLLYDYFSSAISVPIAIKFKSISEDKEYSIKTCDAFMLEFMYDLSTQHIVTEYETDKYFFSNYSFLYINVEKLYDVYERNQENPDRIIFVPVYCGINNYITFHCEIMTLNMNEIEGSSIKIVYDFLRENDIIYIPNERIVFKNIDNEQDIRLITDLNSTRFRRIEINRSNKCQIFKVINQENKIIESINCDQNNILPKIQALAEDGFLHITADYHKFRNKTETLTTDENTTVNIKKEFYHSAYKRIKFKKDDFYVVQVDFVNLYPSLFACFDNNQDIGVDQKAEGILRYTCIKFIDYDSYPNKPSDSINFEI